MKGAADGWAGDGRRVVRQPRMPRRRGGKVKTLSKKLIFCPNFKLSTGPNVRKFNKQ